MIATKELYKLSFAVAFYNFDDNGSESLEMFRLGYMENASIEHYRIDPDLKFSLNI